VEKKFRVRLYGKGRHFCGQEVRQDMFGSQALEVVIGIIFVYILASIICTAVREGLEAWMKTRSVYLEHGIRELLHSRKGGDLAAAVYSHPLVSGLFSGEYTSRSSTGRLPLIMKRGANLPSYIPSKNFALALMDLAARGPVEDAASSGSDTPAISLDAIRANVSKLQNPSVQRVLLTAIDSAQGDINKAQASLEAWYDSGMDRISGWYKRSTQWIVFAIGLSVAVGLNLNTITIVDYLYRNDAAREGIVARAGVASADAGYLDRSYKTVKGDLESMSLPIGWEAGWGAPRPGVDGGVWNNVFAPFLGWFLTAFAASLGAPFWFDVLNKVMVIRSTVKPHEKSPEEASEDRQKPAVQQMGPATQSAETPAALGFVGSGAATAAPAPAAAQPESTPMAADTEGDVDGCEVDIGDPTPDEALPAAKGGVA
jgi:hypothetical protein